MKNKIIILLILSAVLFALSACTTIYPPASTPLKVEYSADLPDTMFVTTSGIQSIHDNDYTTLGIVDSYAYSGRMEGDPAPQNVSSILSTSLREGLIKKAQAMGGDAIIDLEYNWDWNRENQIKTTTLFYLFPISSEQLPGWNLTVRANGTVVKFK